MPHYPYSMFCLISEIPKGDKVFDVEEAINLDTSKLETETTGERIVKQIQEWLLTKVSSSETAVLPEDKMQKLLVGVSHIQLTHAIMTS